MVKRTVITELMNIFRNQLSVSENDEVFFKSKYAFKNNSDILKNRSDVFRNFKIISESIFTLKKDLTVFRNAESVSKTINKDYIVSGLYFLALLCTDGYY